MNSRCRNKLWCIFLLLLPIMALSLLAAPGSASAQETGSLSNPLFQVNLDDSQNPQKTTAVLQIFVLMTVLSLAPALLIMLTSFTRIAIVLSILRQAMGTHAMPPNQVVLGMALFLTFFIMQPTWQEIHSKAVKPFVSGELPQAEALEQALAPLRQFMVKQTREKDLSLMVEISDIERPRNIADVPTTVMIPAFVISELKTAFQMAFIIYIPFLVIDMVVASVLLSMGMMMLPPVMISLPFKLMLFVLADGWYLIVGSLVKSFL